MERHRLRAIYEEDLVKFLESIGIKSAIEKGELKCHVCNEIVSIDTLQAVIPIGKNIGVLCSKKSCLNKIEPESH
jgi:hypothetical protein